MKTSTKKIIVIDESRSIIHCENDSYYVINLDGLFTYSGAEMQECLDLTKADLEEIKEILKA